MKDKDERLFLTDDKIRRGCDLMFLVYREMIADTNSILQDSGHGRAHYRALYFIGRNPGIKVMQLVTSLKVTKQSLNRVLRELLEADLVHQETVDSDRRQRSLYLTESGKNLEEQLFDAQKTRIRNAYFRAGPEAVAGFRSVLELMLETPTPRQLGKLRRSLDERKRKQ